VWQRWNQTTHIFEKSENNGASWVPLPLSASIITEGAIPGVAYTAVQNNFTSRQIIYPSSGSPNPYYGLEIQGCPQIGGDHPGMIFNSTNQPLDGKKWRIVAYQGSLSIEALNDAETGVLATPITCRRDGTLTGINIQASNYYFTYGGYMTSEAARTSIIGSADLVLALPAYTNRVYFTNHLGPYSNWDTATWHLASPGNIQLEPASQITIVSPYLKWGPAGPQIVNDTASSFMFDVLNGSLMYFRGPGASGFANSYFPAPPNAIHCGNGTYPWYAVYAYLGAIQTSDAAEKTDIKDNTLGLSFVEKLRPLSYKYNHDPTLTHVGFTTQDVEEALAGQPWAGLVKDEEGKSGLNYAGFVPILTEAIQELSKRLKVLEGKDVTT